MKKFIAGAIVAMLLVPVWGWSAGQTGKRNARYYTKHSYDVQSYKLDIDLYANYKTPFPRTFTAVIDISFRVDSTLSSIKLNANTVSLAIDSVGQAGTSFLHESNILTVTLDREYQPGETASVRVFYRHKQVNDAGFYVSSGYVFTDSPPEGARKWMPCWDRPSDKATWELFAKVPLQVRLGSAGLLADSVISGDTLVYHWISHLPLATYLITITSSLSFQVHHQYYHKFSNPADSIPVAIYYKATENLSIVNEAVNSITDIYSDHFGDYPFEKIGFATLNGSFPWGGMENQTMVNLQPGGYGDASLIAHEHSHQWFGDLLTCGTWADVWLNEGFATFCNSLWMEHVSGYAAYRNNLNSLATYYLAHNPGWPLYHPEWANQTPNGNTLYNTAITYNKGACVLAQLRYVLGDSVFFRVMNSYATDPAFKFGNVFTADFVQKTNQVSGQDLDWFFDEWVYSPNHPVYQNTYDFDTVVAGRWRVSFILGQTQANPAFFKMPVELKISFTDGTDTLVRVMNDMNRQEYGFTFSREPSAVVFDPDKNILLKQGSTVYSIGKKSGKPGTRLYQNEPNPAGATTRIRYDVGMASPVSVSVLDSSGKVLDVPVDRQHEPGSYSFDWDTQACRPGTYIVTLRAGGVSDSRKMVIRK